MRLNLGCSSDVRAGYVNVDLAQPCDLVVDLNLTWPWEDSSVDEIYAADIFEHLENRIYTMNEVHRVLRPGALLRMECPDASKGAGQWQDPTHVTPWTPNGLQYFCPEVSKAWERFHIAYGITARFKLLECSEAKYVELAGAVRCEVYKFRAVLEAMK